MAGIGSVSLYSGALLLLATIVVSDYNDDNQAEGYIAAVYEHIPILPRRTNLTAYQALKVMESNLEVYEAQVRYAEGQRADIIVFPEYGLFGLFDINVANSRENIHPFLETIPDLGRGLTTPCVERDQQADDRKVQTRLSCMAKDNHIYVVANVGEKRRCDKRRDRSCPSSGMYHYSTNVVYSNSGRLVAKYRRKHFLGEKYYDSPKKAEMVTFQTKFGLFGLTSSYDTLFKEPVIDMINERNVRNIIVPNVWRTSRPLLSSVQWFSAFARGNEINVLTATLHDEELKSFGSGIFLPNGNVGYNNRPRATRGRLLVKTVPVPRYKRRKSPVIPYMSLGYQQQREYNLTMFGMNITFKFAEMTKVFDNVTICQDRFCCNVDYESQGSKIKKYGLGVFKGELKLLNDILAFEICTVVRCDTTCGRPIERSDTYFLKLTLAGYNFTAQHIYPQMLFLDADNDDRVLRDGGWEYEHGKIVSKGAHEDPLLSASLIGRLYSKDREYNEHRRIGSHGKSAADDDDSPIGGASGLTPIVFALVLASMLSAMSLS